MCKIILILSIIFFSCKKEEVHLIENTKFLIGNDTEIFLSKTEFFEVANDIFRRNFSFCGRNFKDEKINLIGENENAFLFSLEKPEKILKFKFYKTIYNDIYLINANCCVTDTCYNTYVLNKNNNEWILENEIFGDLISFKKLNDRNYLKIYDSNITGLVFLKEIYNSQSKVILSFENQSIQIPDSKKSRTLTLIQEREIDLLKRPSEKNSDNQYKKIKLKSETKISVFEEEGNYLFVMFKADETSKENIMKNFEGEGEGFIEKIRILQGEIKTKKDLKKILDLTYVHFGWIEKTFLE